MGILFCLLFICYKARLEVFSQWRPVSFSNQEMIVWQISCQTIKRHLLSDVHINKSALRITSLASSITFMVKTFKFWLSTPRLTRYDKGRITHHCKWRNHRSIDMCLWFLWFYDLHAGFHSCYVYCNGNFNVHCLAGTSMMHELEITALSFL